VDGKKNLSMGGTQAAGKLIITDSGLYFPEVLSLLGGVFKSLLFTSFITILTNLRFWRWLFFFILQENHRDVSTMDITSDIAGILSCYFTMLQCRFYSVVTKQLT